MSAEKSDDLKKIHDATRSFEKIFDKIEHVSINKLSTMRSINQTIEDILPVLLKAYQLALEKKIIEGEIDFIEEKLNLISDLGATIESMFQLFDTIYSFRQELFKKQPADKPVYAGAVVEKILNSYSFKDNNRSLVVFDSKNDFSISCSVLFLNSALLDILDFVFESFHEEAPQKMEIYFSQQNNMNSIHFKINISVSDNEFDRFFNNSLTVIGNKIRPGINFSRLALLNIGGDIIHQLETNHLEITILIPAEI